MDIYGSSRDYITFQWHLLNVKYIIVDEVAQSSKALGYQSQKKKKNLKALGSIPTEDEPYTTNNSTRQ